MTFSIIIPTFNESKSIGKLIDFLIKNGGDSLAEILVVDAGSTDTTKEIAEQKGATFLPSSRGRNIQMNHGAASATGDILYFVHADTFPPATFISCIKKAILNGSPCGCCAYVFDSDKKILKFNSFFNQFNGPFAGGGDQTLYVTKEIFEKSGGFNEEYCIMEDFEYTRRLKKHYNFTVLKSKAKVSARKYANNSFVKVNLVNLAAMFAFWLNVHPTKIKSFYSNALSSYE